MEQNVTDVKNVENIVSEDFDMKAYKIELLVIDFDNLGKDLLIQLIENASYPNDCVTPQVKSVVERDIGEWHDDHPLNKRITANAAYKELFDK